MKKKVAILGSTGSIGTQALDVIGRHRDRFEVVALAAGKQTEKLREQVSAFNVPVFSNSRDGATGLRKVALESGADIVLAATDGFVSFEAVFAAVERGIDVAVANKELIVSAGDLLVAAAKKSGSQIVPVDSEHSAIFQCLVGEPRERVRAIVLTASGGPFWRKSKTEIEEATVEQALAHPTWRMGVKNTVDSATMMNKGLEAIEASRLFDLRPEQVQILVHPQSIAHGMVIFTDGSVKMQACAPDMRVPIGYALAYPDRLNFHGEVSLGHPEVSKDPERREAASKGRREAPLDALTAIGAHPEATALRYDFERPDEERFPCIPLAYRALQEGGTMPAILSAANEVAVHAFVDGEIRFAQIPQVIEESMNAVSVQPSSLDAVRIADTQAREAARSAITALRGVKV